MEYSSPLAAMHPQLAAFGGRKDFPVPRSMYHGYQTYGPNSFNFKDMSMDQPQRRQPARDYFTLRPVRGSSPTSSLTADLDANFHIDKSPQAPTPRRSLFTTDLFKPRDDAALLHTPPIELPEEVATPLIPSSPGIDMMDISPLPHKLPHFVAPVTLPSPSPDETPDESTISPDLLSPDEAPTPLQAFDEQPPTCIALPERKRPVTRPSLTRSKGYSTNCIPQRPTSAETSLPPFRFGNVATHGLSCSSTPTLLESFTESPVDGAAAPSVPASAASMLPPARRPSLGGTSRSTGSPSASHVRKPSVGRPAFARPQRKLIRRSLSMFQHPDDVMREEQDTYEGQSGLASVMDVDQDEQGCMLPHFTSAEEPDGLPRITSETMVDVLENKYAHKYDTIKVIDCRFEYEYNGGHIEDAVNFNDKQQLANELFSIDPPSSTLLVFHCEYSVHRAPLTAKFIRGHDRNVNAAHYPRLSYPEMYILDGGYSQFFRDHRARCQPQEYVEMNDQRHERECERGLARVKGRQKLNRAQTFAFGQSAGAGELDDSPTAVMGGGGRSQSQFGGLGGDVAAGIGKSFARRMASA